MHLRKKGLVIVIQLRFDSAVKKVGTARELDRVACVTQNTLGQDIPLFPLLEEAVFKDWINVLQGYSLTLEVLANWMDGGSECRCSCNLINC